MSTVPRPTVPRPGAAWAREKLARWPGATVGMAAVVTLVSLAEAAAGRGNHGADRLTNMLGLWPARLPGQAWRIITGVLVNPAFRTRTVSLSLFDHWAVNMLLLVSAGRRVERRLGSWAAIGACLAGALASGLWEWGRFPSAGAGGGTSGASFGILGAVIWLGVRAGGGYRRYALGALALTVLVLSWMYDRGGVYFHVVAMGGGVAWAWALADGWPAWRASRSHGALPQPGP